VATLDEWHQSFLPSRTGTFRDVVLDSSAAFVAQIALLAILQMRSFSMKTSVLPEIDTS
jgi:VanZ family protein